MINRVMPLIAALMLVAAGCASSGTSTSSTSAAGQNPMLITTAEIDSSNQRNAYDVVERLRPSWISRARTSKVSVFSGDTTGMVAVYLDDLRQGNIEALKEIPVAQIGSIQWLDAASARATLPGMGMEIISGAIVVRRRPSTVTR